MLFFRVVFILIHLSLKRLKSHKEVRAIYYKSFMLAWDKNKDQSVGLLKTYSGLSKYSGDSTR